MSISNSVGQRGINNKDDVKAIQVLLNHNIDKLTPLRPLVEDGVINPQTIDAIKLFQRRVVGMPEPDGRIDPNGRTLRSLQEGNSTEAKRRAQHLLDSAIRPALVSIGLHSVAAEELLLGTAIVESQLVHRRQIGGGPALGLFQMEPDTHHDIWMNYLSNPQFKGLAARVGLLVVPYKDNLTALEHGDTYAAAMARIRYKRVKDPLPKSGDVKAMAGYWKTHYNTRKGRGIPEEYEIKWKQHDASSLVGKAPSPRFFPASIWMR